jgi:hypothetical protein
VLIPSLYATSLRTQSLRPVRVPSDQNTRWRLPFPFFTAKRQRIPCLPIFFQIHTSIECGWAIAATPHTCDKNNADKIEHQPKNKHLFETIIPRKQTKSNNAVQFLTNSILNDKIKILKIIKRQKKNIF